MHTVKWLNSSQWLTDTASLGQSWSGSNSNEEVLHIFQNSMTETPLSDGLVSYPGHSLLGVCHFPAPAEMFSLVPVTWRCYASVSHELLDPLNYAVNIATVVPTYIFKPTISLNYNLANESKICIW